MKYVFSCLDEKVQNVQKKKKNANFFYRQLLCCFNELNFGTIAIEQ